MQNLGQVTAPKDVATKEYVDHYGVCSTAAATAAKVVTINGVTALTEGITIFVKFANAQTYNGVPTLNVNSFGAKYILRFGSTNAAQQYEWHAGEVLALTYDGTYWIIHDGGIATSNYYGVTKLVSSATSASTSLALTPYSLNVLAETMIAGCEVYSTSKTYAVGDRVRHGSGTYECIVAITTAESWTAAHWQQLDSLQEQVDGKVDTADYAPVVKTSDMTQAVGRDANGQLWTGGLPSVSAADNGKVLTVANGIWAAASLPLYDGSVS